MLRFLLDTNLCIRVLPYDAAAAYHAADIRTALEGRGEPSAATTC